MKLFLVLLFALGVIGEPGSYQVGNNYPPGTGIVTRERSKAAYERPKLAYEGPKEAHERGKDFIEREKDTPRKPTFHLEETRVSPMILLSVRDTARTAADISGVLGRGYGEIFALITKNGSRPGRSMAFYGSGQAGFIVDAAVEVDTFPGQLTGRVVIKKIAGGKAVVARYQGPYEQVGVAYTAIYGWLKEQNKTADGSPFEVYLNDPHSVTDPFDLRTDVYQLFK